MLKILEKTVIFQMRILIFLFTFIVIVMNKFFELRIPIWSLFSYLGF